MKISSKSKDPRNLINKFISNKYICLLYFSLKYKGSLKEKYWFVKNAINALRHGVMGFRIGRVAGEFTDALREQTEMTLEEKWQYCNLGFHPHWKARVGVTMDNYKDYISYFEFYNGKAYVNNRLIPLFDDKLLTYYALNKWEDYVPNHYFYVDKGRLCPLDSTEKTNLTWKSVLELLKQKPLAAKRCHGGHGDGFHKLAYNDGVILIDDKPCNEKDLEVLIDGMDDYLLTDFVYPSKALQDVIGEDSFAVMRVLTTYTPKDGTSVDRMIIRLGTKAAGHTQAGYDILYANIDEEGCLRDTVYEYSGWHCEKMETHPETNKTVEGFKIEGLSELKEVLIDMASRLSVAPYLVWDIIPTDDSFSILEINSHGQLENFERFESLKKNKKLCQLMHLS
jgi:hypothetical protein